MRKYREASPRGQLALLPPTVEEFVGKDDQVRFVDALVEEFDLSEIERKYSYNGRPAYNPRVLIKILLYGKIRGVRSSRELSRACKENLRFIFLAQQQKPDFRTLSDFRRRFLCELGELLKQTVEIGLEEGFISLEHVAIDGTKIRANASAKSFKSKEKLEELLSALEESLKEDVKKEAEEEKSSKNGDNDDDEPKLPEELTEHKALAEKVKKALSAIGDRKRVSLTDSDANFMESQGGCHPSYNGQLAVDEASRMIVGAYTSTAGSDHGELKPMVKEIYATTGKNPEQVSADKGFRDTDGIKELYDRSIVGFVALQEAEKERIPAREFSYDPEEDEYTCPCGSTLVFIGAKHEREADIYKSEDCSDCPITKDCLRGKTTERTLVVSRQEGLVAAMRERMESEEGKEMIQRRSATVEPTFAILKVHRNLRQFAVRGLKAVNAAWKFEAAAINVFRLTVQRMQLIAKSRIGMAQPA